MSYVNDIDTLNGYTVEVSVEEAYGNKSVRVDIPDSNGEAEYHCMVRLSPDQAREIAAALNAAADTVEGTGKREGDNVMEMVVNNATILAMCEFVNWLTSTGSTPDSNAVQYWVQRRAQLIADQERLFEVTDESEVSE